MISLAMIVKNEVQTIERTILSVKDYVDEIVIGLDTTSDDGTKAIIDQFADKVIDIHLTEELAKKGSVDSDSDWGFSKARNIVFNACAPDNWRLVLDGHETIKDPEKMTPAIKQAKAAKCDGIEIWCHFEPDQNDIPRQMFGTSRLFAPSVYYNNPIHNVPVVKSTHVLHNIIVEHRKQDQAIEDKQARDVQRADANIEGLRNKVRVDSNDPRSWYYLATAYKESARWDEAIKAYQECLKYDKWNEQRWHARVNMATCYSTLGDQINAREQFSLALDEFPIMAEAYYWLGDLAYKQQRFREAQVWLEKCVEMEIPKCKLFVTPSVYLLNRYDLLSMVYNHLGRYADAATQAKKALEAAPNPRIQKNVEIWEKLSK